MKIKIIIFFLSCSLLIHHINFINSFGFNFGGGGGRQRQQQQRQQRQPARQVDPELQFDPYKELGLNEDDEPSASEIKKAYRKLSLKLHPDKPTGDEAKFQKVSRAYEILSDEENKFLYDFGGMKAVKDNEEAKKHEEAAGGRHDPFRQFFGGRQGQQNKGPTAQLEFEVSLEDLYNGSETQAKFNRRVVCRGCSKEKGGDKKAKCKLCPNRCPNEVRMVQKQMGPGFIVQQQEEVNNILLLYYIKILLIIFILY